MWLRSDELAKSRLTDQLLENSSITREVNLKERIKAKDQCIGMKIVYDAKNKASSATLLSLHCNAKNRAICLLETSKLHTTQKRKRFPCISKNVRNRKKRNINDKMVDTTDFNKRRDDSRGIYSNTYTFTT